MFEEIKKIIEKCRVESDYSFSIDSFTNHNDKKVEIVLSTKDYMASISILPDFTYDLIAIEISSEIIVLSETKYHDNIEGLIIKLKTDLMLFSQFSK
jgi:hypothetical protein